MGRRRSLPEEPIEIQIETLEQTGRGSGAYDGQRLEVFDALPGETVRAKYLFGRRFRGQAQAIEVLTASAERIDPRCPHFGVCSACSLQHLTPAAQIGYKQRWLLRHLQRQGEIEPEVLLPPLQDALWHYRRKARLSVRFVRGKGRVLVGFRERDGRFVADIRECHILPAAVSGRIPDLAGLVASMDASETIPQIEVTCGDDGCVLVVRHLEPLSDADRERLLVFSRETGLVFYLQGGGPQTIEPLQPPGVELVYRLAEHDLEYRFQPQDFVQVNAGMNQCMVRQALDLLELQPEDEVLELFAGLGNFSLPMARRCRSVIAVEGDPGLVARAARNAERNGVGNVRFVEADLYRDEGGPGWPGRAYHKALIDPPRSGARQVLQPLSDSGVQRLVYVSCNPETLAADAHRLVREFGFTLSAAGVMDMFPHTTHVESMALFTRS
jgi:23S rRNA (uracil1939-C5)-methyltransferase